MEKKVSAVLVAAGSSTRMGFDKLSFDLGGETVLHRSIRAFAQCPLVDEIILVAGSNRAFAQQQAADCAKPVCVVAGGATRAESAKNGVLAASGALVAVHDAARPFVSQQVITAALEAAARCGAAAPAVPVKDTIKIVDEEQYSISTPDRSVMWQMQTPQCFRLSEIREAYRQMLENGDTTMTDDAMVMEKYGSRRVKMIMGSYENIKLTTPGDFILGEAILQNMKKQER